MYQTIRNMKQPRVVNRNVVENYQSNALKNSSHTRKNQYGRRVQSGVSQRNRESFQLQTVKPVHESFEQSIKLQEKDPKSVWGRPLWFTLHYGALNYPENPDASMRNMMVGYIKGLPIMIPCDICKNHAYEYINKCSTTKLWDATESKESLFKFFWEFHNDVNFKTNKPRISLEKAYNIYKNNPGSAYI